MFKKCKQNGQLVLFSKENEKKKIIRKSCHIKENQLFGLTFMDHNIPYDLQFNTHLDQALVKSSKKHLSKI